MNVHPSIAWALLTTTFLEVSRTACAWGWSRRWDQLIERVGSVVALMRMNPLQEATAAVYDFFRSRGVAQPG